MPNIINEMIARELKDSYETADGMVFLSYNGVTVAENEKLRTELEEKGVRLRMVRNRIARIVLCERGLEPPADLLKGNVVCVAGTAEDAINAAKVFKSSDLFKKAKKVTFRGGVLEGSFLGSDEAQALADLPGKDELRAMMLGVISGPARSLVGILHAPGSSLARVLQARIDAEGGGDAAEGDAA